MERTVRKLVGRVLRGHVTAALVSVSVGVRMATQAPSVKQVTTPPPRPPPPPPPRPPPPVQTQTPLCPQTLITVKHGYSPLEFKFTPLFLRLYCLLTYGIE